MSAVWLESATKICEESKRDIVGAFGVNPERQIGESCSTKLNDMHCQIKTETDTDTRVIIRENFTGRAGLVKGDKMTWRDWTAEAARGGRD